ncbi:DUF4234 domain-containing protein [Streptomyces marispadix]|uniref:DUF4234 domain-containing protein n=1 Tax=Streptomyces marispadix TaxID=2922868 RepID=A0ABS9SZG4_9ACTN|nr:DUF4234 domain-containing protein [Streptomyces marispadix]MCH6161684.1 DUF4234 domain-containing protein [Streptomyces marispadix]
MEVEASAIADASARAACEDVMEQVQAVQRVDRYVHERRFTDQSLTSWALCFFLLSWITLGIYPVYLFYRRCDRADRFRIRRLHYYDAVVEATRQYAELTGRYETCQEELGDLQRFVKERFVDEHKPIRAGLSLFLAFITLGIYGFYAVYRMMRFWWQIQFTEQDFDEKLSRLWADLGVVRYPVTFEVDEEVDRSFGLYLFLTIVTLGIFGIVWDYHLHTDPDRIFPEFHSAEDAVLGALRMPPPIPAYRPQAA